ncbi:MAG: PRC-barrel domain-containing protein [Longimicrobiales bacterium]
MGLRVLTADMTLSSMAAFDVHEWRVHTLIDNVRAGVVHQLLIDEQDKPRYVDVALDGVDRCLLVPIGQARADRALSLVWLPGLAAYQLELIPSFAHGPLARGAEVRLLNAFTAALAGAMPRVGYRVLSTRRQRRPAAFDPARLVPLSEHPELCLASDEADPRGWSVMDCTGRLRGTIRDLLVDLTIRRVRYAIAELETPAAQTRSVLLPVEFLRLDPGAAQTALPVFNEALLGALPDYLRVAPDRETEAAILELFAQHLAVEVFYGHARFDDTAFFGTA